jgi:formate hydrogenlyase subunit 4
MSALLLAHLAALLGMPFVMSGVINRVKSRWSGRRGPPILQSLYDVARLLRKSSVYGAHTTPVFRAGPYVALTTALAAAALTPLLGAAPLASFPYDLVALAYLWGLGRVASILAALDVGSSFEGMGAARDATFATLVEPTLFLVLGALSLMSGAHTLQDALSAHPRGGASLVVWGAAVAALTVVLQVEAARMPVDDPTTHLELTMTHEVMTLDHSGPDLAAIQVGAAIKLFVIAAMIATLLNPWSGEASARCAATNLALCLGVAAALGTLESLVARLKLRAVPQYILVGFLLALVGLLATAWRTPGAP